MGEQYIWPGGLGMLSISPPARGAGKGDYYLLLAREDYYTGGGEPEGRWYGEGAKSLGLSGIVSADELRHVMRGYDPSGKEALVQNAGEGNRQCFWDLTFSAPKSVSVAWSQASKEVAQEIQKAQAEAVKAALEYLEANCAFTRRGKGGATNEKVELVVAAFEHGTSRAQDPQLHTHCLLQNLGIREDGTTGTIISQIVYAHKMAVGALYRAELASQLEKRLGLLAERKGRVFELKGVSEELVREFSKRRRVIERELRDVGLKTAKAADVAALNTREVKEALPREQLFSRWQEIGRKHGWSSKQLEGLLQKRTPKRLKEREKEEAVTHAISETTEQKSFISQSDLIRFTAESAQGKGLGASDVLAAVSSALKNSPEIVALGQVKGEMMYSTRAILRLEKQLLDGVQRGKNEERFTVSEKIVNRNIHRHETLSEEQRRAVLHLTRKPGGVQVISGMAGTGKSFMLGVARECWEDSGLHVLGGALAGKAAQGLYEGSGIKSETLHRLISSIDSGRLKIDARTVVVVDEAAMVGTKQLYEVFKRIGSGKGKLVLVGDERQLQSIEAGGAFVAISREVGEAELTENRRQEEAWTKSAVALFSQGRSQEALSEYAKRGLVTLKERRDTLMHALVDDWAKKGVDEPKDQLILTSERDDVLELNRLSQSMRRSNAKLGEKSLRVGEDEFFERDRVLITRNSRTLGVKNGQLGTVRHVNRHFGRMTIALDSGRFVSHNINDFPHVELGYAVTTHKAQGMTAKDSYILVGGSMQDREITYVQASRGKSETRFYMTNGDAGDRLSAISRQMSKSRRKELAHSVLEPKRKLTLSL